MVLSATPCANAQVVLQPTPDPLVTAERTEWYLAGEPITYDGFIYYPVGAPVHFNRYEMVRSGSFRGVPLYARTTLEPYSIVFLPLAGGVMQPYERRRSGDVAGTVGSTTPGLPVVIATRGERSEGVIPQAPAPPVVTGAVAEPETRTIPATGATETVPAPVGSSGRAPMVAPPQPYEPLIRPRGLNAVFVDFKGERWFLDGSALSLEGMSVTQIGSRHGFPVYATAPDATTIYIPVTRDAGSLATPFSTRRSRR
jgi:hypothetical protein